MERVQAFTDEARTLCTPLPTIKRAIDLFYPSSSKGSAHRIFFPKTGAVSPSVVVSSAASQS